MAVGFNFPTPCIGLRKPTDSQLQNGFGIMVRNVFENYKGSIYNFTSLRNLCCNMCSKKQDSSLKIKRYSAPIKSMLQLNNMYSMIKYTKKKKKS